MYVNYIRFTILACFYLHWSLEISGYLIWGLELYKEQKMLLFTYSFGSCTIEKLNKTLDIHQQECY